MKKILYIVFLMAILTTIYSGVSYALSGWQYYRDITIDNTGNSNTLTDYQVLVTVDTATIISEGKINNDCSDIRFTESDGTTELSYWIEDGTCNTATTKIWVKVPSIPASSTYTIQMWYGNPSATSKSDATAVFIFYEDFSSGLSKWSSVDPNCVIDATSLNLTCITDAASSGWFSSDTNTLTTFNTFCVDFDWTKGAGASGGIIHVMVDASNEYRMHMTTGNGDGPYIIKKVAGTDTTLLSDTTLRSIGTYHTAFCYDGSTITANIYGTTYSVADSSLSGFTYLEITHIDGSTAGTAETNWDNIILRQYTSPEPTTSIGVEQQPVGNYVPQITITSPTETTYYGITSQTFTFKVVDMDNATFIVRAYLNGTLIYEDTAYTNDTIVSFTHPVAGYGYNFTVYATDNLDDNSHEVDFYVWYGANITANTDAFDLTVGVRGVNTTYTGIDYKKIEWKDIGNNTLAELWVTKTGFDMDYKAVLFNDTMGLLNVQMNIYTAYTFWLYDTENGKFIKDWTLTIVNSTNTYVYSTTDYDIKVSTRMINEGTYTLNATAFGYDYVTEVMLLNNSVALNYTFNTKPVDFIIRVYDEETLNEIGNTSLTFYMSDGSVWSINSLRKYLTITGTGSVISPQNIYDNDISTAARAQRSTTDADGNEIYGNVGILKGKKGLLCVKLKYNYDPAYADSQPFNVKLYNKTSGTWVTIISGNMGQLTAYQIEEKCGTYDNTHGDFGEVANVSFYYVSYNDYVVDLYIYEIYPKEVPETVYSFEPTDLGNDEIQIVVKDIKEVTLIDHDYATRRYYITLNPYSSLTLNAYLLKSTFGLYYTITTLDYATGQPLQNVLITASKYLNGAYRTVEQIKTNPDGTGTVFLKPYDLYKLAFIKNGYVTAYYNYIPSTNNLLLTVKLNKSSIFITNITTMLSGISYRVTPNSGVIELDDNTTLYNQTFKLSVYSDEGSLALYGLEVYCNGTKLYGLNVTDSPGGGEISYTYNVAKCSNMSLAFYIQKSGFVLFTQVYKYFIEKWYNVGLMKAVSELKNIYDETRLMMLIVISLIITASILSLINPETAAVGVLALEGIYTYFGFISLNMFVLMFIISLAVIFIMSRIRM